MFLRRANRKCFVSEIHERANVTETAEVAAVIGCLRIFSAKNLIDTRMILQMNRPFSQISFTTRIFNNVLGCNKIIALHCI